MQHDITVLNIAWKNAADVLLENRAKNVFKDFWNCNLFARHSENSHVLIIVFVFSQKNLFIFCFEQKLFEY